MKPWKMRKLVEDVIWDLRQRGLLPVVALLVVAMVVVPVMILQGGKTAPTGGPDAVDISAPEAESAVLAYNPGLRNYQKRLDKLAKKDPFLQHFTGSGSGESVASQLDSTVASLETGSVTETETIKGGGHGKDDDGVDNVVTKTRYQSYRLDLVAGEIGQPKVYKHVSELTFVPSEAVPVVLFLGIGGNGTKALFLVSSDVSDVEGDGACVPNGGSPCNMLTLKGGQSEYFTYAPTGKAYQVKVRTISQVVRTVHD